MLYCNPSLLLLLLVRVVVHLTLPVQAELQAVELLHADYAGVQFSKRGIFPPTTIVINITGSDFRFNKSDACIRAMPSAISGPGWLPSLISAVSFAEPNNPEFADNDTFNKLVLTVEGNSAFVSQGSYWIEVPSNCTSGLVTQLLNFTITQGRRSSIGRLSTFVVLFAAGVGILAAILGSTMPLILTQLLALTSSLSAGPIQVQEEFEILRYTLIPFDYKPLLKADFDVSEREARMLLVALAVILVAAFEEAIRTAFELYFACKDSTMEVDKFGLPLRSVNAGKTPTLAVPLLNQAPPSAAADSRTDSVASPSAGPEHVLSPLPAPTGRADGQLADDDRWALAAGTVHDYRGAPIPPYYVYVFQLGMMLGVCHCAVRTLFAPRTTMFASGVSLICVLLFAIGCVGASMTFSRQPNLFWCMYSTQRSSIPISIQPSGTWGPNSVRERQAPYLCTWKKGCKGVSPFFYLLILTTSLISGMSPSTSKGALLALGLVDFCICLLLLIAVLLRPFRTIMTNVWLILGLSCVFIASVFVSTHIAANSNVPVVSRSAAMSMHATGHLGATAAGAICLTVAGLIEVSVRLWELLRGRERRASREGERARRQRLLLSSSRTSRIRQRQMQDMVNTLVDEIVVNAKKTNEESLDTDSRNERVAGRRVPRYRAASVWRQGHQEIVATDQSPPTLAEYLVQDFDFVPLETREEILLADERMEKERQNASRHLNDNVPIVQPSQETKPKDFVHHQHPPCLSTVSLDVDTRLKKYKPDYDL